MMMMMTTTMMIMYVIVTNNNNDNHNNNKTDESREHSVNIQTCFSTSSEQNTFRLKAIIGSSKTKHIDKSSTKDKPAIYMLQSAKSTPCVLCANDQHYFLASMSKLSVPTAF